MSTAELVETERQCIDRFRAKAVELRAGNPQMSPSIALSRAISALPNTLEKYQATREQLILRGVAPQLLR